MVMSTAELAMTVVVLLSIMTPQIKSQSLRGMMHLQDKLFSFTFRHNIMSTKLLINNKFAICCWSLSHVYFLISL